jgi:EamA domain-containing membrane protein RarD
MSGLHAVGLLTLYWPLLDEVGVGELLAHRVVWALGVLVVALAIRRRWGWQRELLAAHTARASSSATATGSSTPIPRMPGAPSPSAERITTST